MTAAQPAPRRFRIGHAAMMWLISWVATATVWEPALIMLGIVGCGLIFIGLLLWMMIFAFIVAP